MNPVETFLLHKAGMDPGDAAEVGAAMGTAGRTFQRNPFVKSVGRGVALGGAFALGSAGVAALGAAAAKMFDAVTKKRDFDRMLVMNPHLKRYQEAEPEAFNGMFSALRAMNPSFTREPLVAGAYMTEAMEQAPETRGLVAVKALQERTPVRIGPASEAALGGYHRALGLKPDDLAGYFVPRSSDG